MTSERFLSVEWNPEGTVKAPGLFSRIGSSIQMEEGKQERRVESRGGRGSPSSSLESCSLVNRGERGRVPSPLCEMERLKSPLQFWDILLL